MVSGIEGVGEAVTGGMIARAVEPAAGEAGEDHRGNCLNCGAALTGPFCQLCGQKGHVHRTLGAFWHDLAHAVLHFEGKIWRTLPMLAWRPGELTRRYIAGERARFVSPMALFLFSVFLMFATFSLIGGPFAVGSMAQMSAEDRVEAERDFDREQAVREAALDRRRAERARLAAAGQSTAAIDSEIAGTERGMRLSEMAFRQSLNVVAAAPDAPAAPAAPEHGAGDTADPSGIVISDRPSSFEWLNNAIRHARENPSLLIYKLQSNAYKFSWALIPISVPFLWLLFLHRRRYRQQYKAYDHVVFVTYSIAFMSLGLIALSLLRPIGVGTGFMVVAILLVPPVHIFWQLRGAYQLSVFSTLWRTLALVYFALFAAFIFFTLLVVLGLLG